MLTYAEHPSLFGSTNQPRPNTNQFLGPDCSMLQDACPKPSTRISTSTLTPRVFDPSHSQGSKYKYRNYIYMLIYIYDHICIYIYIYIYTYIHTHR